MLTDRQRILLAVLRARGPADAYALRFHSTLAEHYPDEDLQATIQADLEALVAQGYAVANHSPISGRVEAYDHGDVDRSGWRARYDRDDDWWTDGLGLR